MEVLLGPTFGIEVAASVATYVRDRPQKKIASSCLFLKEEDVGGDDPTHGSNRGSPDVFSESSSSIGSLGDSDDEEEEEDGVVSSGASGGLASLGSLEDSLPIKRGLSNHYAGKSRSFANLSDISTVKDLQKIENPFNKRRKVLLANKWSRKSYFYSWQNPNSMPLLALNEDDEDEDGEDKETPSSSSLSTSTSSSSNDNLSVAATKPKLQQSKLKATYKSQSCFSLTDLQVEHQ